MSDYKGDTYYKKKMSSELDYILTTESIVKTDKIIN
jgi:hypothetical protein